MKQFGSRLLVWGILLAYFFQVGPARAASGSVDSIVSRIKGLENGLPEAPAAEYVLRKYPGEKLIPVRLLGGVNRAGIYYLPEGTDLLTAISLAAGVDGDADANKIHWNKSGTGTGVEFSMDELMKRPKETNPVLTANDLIYVEKREPLISNNTMLVLTAISAMIGIVVGGIAIKNSK